jgi:hypothetical protein
LRRDASLDRRFPAARLAGRGLALRAHGLRSQDVGVVSGAAAGPKGLVLSHLDRLLFGRWLARGERPLHLMGASIGAWRFAHACLADSAGALERLAHDYIHESYEHPSGTCPPSHHVSAVMRRRLEAHFAGREAEALSHPRFRLHVFTSRGRHALLRRQGRLRTALGYAAAVAVNAASRAALGGLLERVVFSDPRDAPPVPMRDFRTTHAQLDEHNFRDAVLASCSIPFWLDAVHDIPGAPPGA